jgi:hypothetical protein
LRLSCGRASQRGCYICSLHCCNVSLLVAKRKFGAKDDRYLFKSNTVNRKAQNLQLAYLCLDYLNLEAFDSEKTRAEIETLFLLEFYAFFDYALLSWTKHLQLGLHGTPPPDIAQIRHCEEQLDVLLEVHWQEPDRRIQTKTPSMLECAKLISDPQLQDQVLSSLAAVEAFHAKYIVDTTPYETVDLFQTMTRVREAIERLAQDPTRAKVLVEYHSRYLFKCPRVYCSSFYNGFKTRDERDAHKAKHERSFLCPRPGRHLASLGCPTEKDLKNHIAAYHKLSDTDFPEMPDEESGPPVFRCEECQKTFTRASNLKAHRRIHKGDKPYACSTCQSHFARQGDLKRHEQSHATDLRYVCGGKLGSGEDWGCGKEYSRLDGLARHLKRDAGRNDCTKPTLSRIRKPLDDKAVDAAIRSIIQRIPPPAASGSTSSSLPDSTAVSGHGLDVASSTE